MSLVRYAHAACKEQLSVKTYIHAVVNHTKKIAASTYATGFGHFDYPQAFKYMTFKLKIKCILSYLLTYLLTPWSRVLLEKLTGSAASQEIPRIFGTRRFITVLTSARHQSLS